MLINTNSWNLSTHYSHAARRMFLLIIVAIAATAIVGHFYDQFSYLPDDGAYAYVASRILAGDVLNRDIQDVHAGYINFTNALSFYLFGERLVSMRYFLAAITVLQACFAFWIVSETNVVTALVAAVGMVCLSFVQFLNPTAHWYCLFLTVLAIYLLSQRGRLTNRKLVFIGFVIATIFLYRQLTGVIVAIAVMTALFINHSEDGDGARRQLLKWAWIPINLLLLFYVLKRVGLTEIVIIGIWPVMAGIVATVKSDISDKEISRICARMLLGGTIATLPLVAYHLFHGSMGDWLNDTILVATSLSQQDFVLTARYGEMISRSMEVLISAENLTSIANSMFWIFLLILPTMLGIMLLKAISAARPTRWTHPVLTVGCYYSLVSLHYQIPIYIFYTSGLTLIAILLAAATWSRGGRWAMCIASGFFAFIALYYHAAQPVSRGMHGTITGQRTTDSAQCDIPRMGIAIEVTACSELQHLISIIESRSEKTDTILALPTNAELNFFSMRKSPVKFFNSSLGLTSREKLDAAITDLKNAPPKLIFFRPEDKYNTSQSLDVLTWVRDRYVLLDVYAGFEIYIEKP